MIKFKLKSTVVLCSLSFTLGAGYSTAFAAEGQPESKVTGASATPPSGIPGTQFHYATVPEGKSLPANIARVRLPYQSASGNFSYDGSGKKVDSPVKANASGTSFIFEYGINDKLSFQWKTDYVINQSSSVNTGSTGYTNLKSSVYASKTAQLAAATGVTITDQNSLKTAIQTAFIGACTSSQVAAGTAAATASTNCQTSYANGTLTSASASAIGLSSSFGAGSSSVSAATYAAAASSAADAQISTGIASQAETSSKGLGDTQVGVLYEAYDNGSLFVSLSGGLRVPTGNRNTDTYEPSTSRGAYEVGARENIDYLAHEYFMISWQNQSEVGVLGTKHNVGGVSTSTRRSGVRNVGFVYLKPSLAGLTSALEPFKSQVGVTYDFDSATITKQGDADAVASPHSQAIWGYAGIGYSLIEIGVPLQFDLEYETPIQGQNISVAVAKTTATVKAFAKF